MRSGSSLPRGSKLAAAGLRRSGLLLFALLALSGGDTGSVSRRPESLDRLFLGASSTRERLNACSGRVSERPQLLLQLAVDSLQDPRFRLER